MIKFSRINIREETTLYKRWEIWFMNVKVCQFNYPTQNQWKKNGSRPLCKIYNSETSEENIANLSQGIEARISGKDPNSRGNNAKIY